MKGNKMTSLFQQLKSQFASGSLAKAEFIIQMHECLHSSLFAYANHLGETDIAKIEICDGEVIMTMGLPRFRGQVDRSHAMTLRLSIDDQPNQDQAPVHASAEAGGY
jgi:hypothetical protein